MPKFDKHLLRRCGCDVRIASTVVITNPQLVSIGDHVAIDDFTYATTAIEIGSYVHIGPHSSIIGGPHGSCTIDDFCSIAAGARFVCGSDDFVTGSGLTNPTIPPPYHGTLDIRPIVLRKHVILGTSVVILPGVTIGDGAAVGACGLVVRDLDPWWLYVGIPARAHKPRKSSGILERAARLRRELAQLE